MPEYIYYKIISKNENIKDIYVGKTTNFKKRILRHKSDCNNENDKNYNIKVYQYIRENGGINNFNFIEIETNEYNDKDSAFRERYWIEELNATLNSVIPSTTYKECCEKHNKRQKKYFDKNREIINEKKREKITCECGCEIRKDYLSTHLKSKKHINYLSNTK